MSYLCLFTRRRRNVNMRVKKNPGIHLGKELLSIDDYTDLRERW